MRYLLPLLFVFSVGNFCCSTKNIQTELYFGLSKPDGSLIADSSWKHFTNNYISKVFTEGFTEIAVAGKWRDTVTKQIISEPSYQVISVNKMTRGLSARIDSLKTNYKQLFDQQAVLRIDKKVVLISF